MPSTTPPPIILPGPARPTSQGNRPSWKKSAGSFSCYLKYCVGKENGPQIPHAMIWHPESGDASQVSEAVRPSLDHCPS